MGGAYFYVEQGGYTAEQAFQTAVDEALHEYGHGGYTGTIAEKSGFVMVDPMPDAAPADFDVDNYDYRNPEDWADYLHERMPYDKWGKARCFEAYPGVWAFFGDAPQ